MRLLVLVLALTASAALQAQPASRDAPSRGQLLYSNHCIECHSTQMHWRDQRLARDWESLKAQVWRWQNEIRLGWTPEDVEAVSRHLNDTVYQFPQPQARR
jgi:mono/diheme cytochrome c family protein